MANYTKEEQIEMIKNNFENLKEIDNQYEDVCLQAVRENGYALKYVKNPTLEICLEAVRQNGYALEFVKEQKYEIALEAVKQNGWALEYIEEQTPEICLEAVKQNPLSIGYVKNQTPEICLEAIQRNPSTICYIQEQTEELCLEAVKRDGLNVKRIKNKTPKLCFYAYLNSPRLSRLENIKINIDLFMKENSNLNHKIFCFENEEYFNILNNRHNSIYEAIHVDYSSMSDIENYLVQNSSNNYFIFPNWINIDTDIFKKLALSNNKVILINEAEGDLNVLYTTLANHIISIDELETFNFI